MTAVKETILPSARAWLGQPQNAFLVLAGFFGLLMVFVTPPALVGDEPNHFFRAYQISDGVIISIKHEGSSGGWLPRNVLDTNRRLVGDIEMNHHIKFDTNLIWELRQLPLDEQDKVFVPFHNTVVYAPVPYIPQIIGILVGKTFSASPIGVIYFARVVNLAFFLALSYLALMLTPVHKWTWCFLWLTPTTVFQAASASVDAFTFGICFLVIAYFLFHGLNGDETVGGKHVAVMFGLCLLAVLSKQAYILLPFLFLVIPARKFPSRMVYYTVFLALIAVCFAAVAAWSAVVKPIFVQYRGDVVIDPDAQLSFILWNPFEFLAIAIWSYIKLSGYYFVTFFGQLTWLDLFVPRWLTIFLFAALLMISVFDKGAVGRIPPRNKLVFAAIVSGTALIISVLLYLSWSPVGADRVAGIQGRYFIPVAPLFFILLYNQKWRSALFERRGTLMIYSAVVFSLVVTLYTIIQRYYL